MNSPFDDPQVLSTSPSMRGVSPTKRRNDRDSFSSTSSVEHIVRARGSPTHSRSLGSKDPDARERQRTLDVDMALQLSRARRETLVQPTSPFDVPETDAEPPFGSYSAIEQHDFELARGEASLVLDQETIHGSVRDTVPGSGIALGIEARDPSPFAAIESQYPLPDRQNPTSSMSCLPQYQVVSPRSVFDFAMLENFATEEKESLGLASSGPPMIRVRHSKEHKDTGQPTPSGLPNGSFDPTTAPRRPSARQRKLSESAPLPRPLRRNGRGKVALFEHQANESASGFPARLMATGQLSAVPSSDDVSGMFYQYVPPPHSAGAGGAGSPGHDRPYRFSFYSNALSATIHARSLCELPAEGQSFEDLFCGLLSPSPRQGDTVGGSLAPSPIPASRPGFRVPSGWKTPLSSEGLPMNYRNGFSGRPADSGPGRPNGSGSATGVDAEANTWWLDIQSPTDEEMKVLSKVITFTFFHVAYILLTRHPKVFFIHPLTTEDIQMEEAREKIELFRNYYLVCFRSFDQDPYSPTYLEPLNMYIIVFREGILSVRPRICDANR